MYIKKRIYILVKTYPVVSDKYSELVCTAGILEDGSWIRLYPVPFRFLEDEKRFPKFSWIEVEVQKRSEDFRPESYSPNLDTLRVEEKMPVNWRERKRSILKSPVYSDLSQLIRQAKSSKRRRSLYSSRRGCSISRSDPAIANGMKKYVTAMNKRRSRST